jgi:hypothetical protein
MKDRTGKPVRVDDTIRILPSRREAAVVGLDAFANKDGSWRHVAFTICGTWKEGNEAKNIELIRSVR